jgi:hypothetical protein
MINKIRLWLVKKLLNEKDGYVYLGLQNSEPINFYYDENINEYVLGMRSGNFYYATLNMCGLSFYMSRYLPWDNDKLKEPKKVQFNEWIYGVLEQINKQYKEIEKDK